MRDEFKDPEAARLYAEWILATVAKMPEVSIEALATASKFLGSMRTCIPAARCQCWSLGTTGRFRLG
jgi:hypothetical protein